MYRKPFLRFVIDILIVTFSFLFWIWLKPATLHFYLPTYSKPFLLFLFIWFASAVFTNKYTYKKNINLLQLNRKILYGNFLALGIVAIIMFSIRIAFFSRQVVLGTIFTATLIELAMVDIFYYFSKAKEETSELDVQMAFEEALPRGVHTFKSEKKYDIHETYKESIRNNIIAVCGKEVYAFLNENINLFSEKTLILATNTQFNIDKQQDEFYENIINLKRVNDIRYINKYLEAVNSKLPFGGVFISCGETKNLRKIRILNKFPPIVNYIYYFFDFIIKRVFPKFSLTKRFYFFLTRGENRVLTRAEILGRLYSCGFEIARETIIGKNYFFIAHKVSHPYIDEDPTYGPFIKLRRIGQRGKIIKVYKFRTMHPYSEYIQELVYDRNNLDEGGKLKNDFRVSTLGKILRKLWLDELPMLINLLKGQLKIVGVRPLSEHYFGLYSKELKEKRVKYKPGLIPPYYVDMPKTLEEIMDSEMKYLDAYEKHPLKTDVKYFFKAMYNIIFRHARSN